ncbi:MAG TPA: serine/threonine-protein kinase [Nocardioides sp.]|nr:serine/threonine-protein kinase [Nocardioides sp.]
MAPQTIADRYDVERPVGHGGMGTVWLCRDTRLDREVAVKQVGTFPGEAAPDLARALREARSSAALNHLNVVSIYDVIEEGDQIWLVMEYVRSRTLAEIIAADGPLSPERAAWIGAQVAEGLAAAHALGTMHRDVKPGNILVTDDDVAKISDFGIARAHGDDQLTRTGLVTGTPAYFSPELARGEDPTPAADIWALGATLYAAVEGHPPFPDERNAIVLLSTIASTPPPVPQRAGVLTEPIARMLDPDPSSRWTMADAAHVLRRMQGAESFPVTHQATTAFAAPAPGAPTTDAPAPDEPRAADRGREGTDGVIVVPPAGRQPRRRRGLLAAGVVVLLVLALAVAYLLWPDPATDEPSTSGRSTDPSATSGGQPGGGPGPGSGQEGDPSTAPTPTSEPDTAAPVSGAGAEEFVRGYYASLPADTEAGWAALSPEFQDQVGSYGDYEGFWSSIESVAVGDVTPAEEGAVDVALTYTTTDGRVDEEVRRIYLVSGDDGYLIQDDEIVG